MTGADDEFRLLVDNAAEVGLELDREPVVRRRSVDLADGRRISALVWGDGAPEAVLIHGGAQNAHTWDTVALVLDRPLVAVDLPGHGHSDWRPDHDYSPAVLAADVAAALDVLAPTAPLTVGMSLGGLTSIALAAARPDLVARLVLVDITPGVDAVKARAITEFVTGPESFASLDEVLERTLRFNPGRSPSSLRRGVVHNTRQRPDGSWSWRWDPVRRAGVEGSPTGVADLWDVVGDLRAPLTLIRGGDSPVVDDADVAELVRRRPEAEVVVVAGAGHSIQGDRPRRLAELVAARLPDGAVVPDRDPAGPGSPDAADHSATHRYQAAVEWAGSTGQGYAAYDRAHRLAATTPAPDLALSSDPAFGGDPSAWNPEQLLVAAAVSCQLLSFLAVAARARLDVVAYRDDAEALMPMDDPPARLVAIALRPAITLREGAGGRVADERLHHLVDVAHRECYVANTLSCPVTVTPTFRWLAAARPT